MSDLAIVSWDEIPNSDKFKTILIGNGHSIAFHSKFRYGSLLDEANFTGSLQTLFDDFGTSDFEIILESLYTAGRVLEVFGQSTELIENAYEGIRRRLFEIIGEIHCDYQPDRLGAISSILSNYGKIFTTNYDLLLYWVAMVAEPHFMDFFNPMFRSENSSWNPLNGLYYVHGALHIWSENQNGLIGKYVQDDRSLLQVIQEGTPGGVGRHPLFVSEGTSEQKLNSIRRSRYLSFAFEQLRLDSENVVVFGSSLGFTDDHIVRALGSNGYNGRRIVISRRSGSESSDAMQRWVEVKELLERMGNSVTFFEASSHPLGGV